eukprot:SAG31_NODE_211_length_20274_cov_40.333482_2_plen_147_part_00
MPRSIANDINSIRDRSRHAYGERAGTRVPVRPYPVPKFRYLVRRHLGNALESYFSNRLLNLVNLDLRPYYLNLVRHSLTRTGRSTRTCRSTSRILNYRDLSWTLTKYGTSTSMEHVLNLASSYKFSRSTAVQYRYRYCNARSCATY